MTFDKNPAQNHAGFFVFTKSATIVVMIKCLVCLLLSVLFLNGHGQTVEAPIPSVTSGKIIRIENFRSEFVKPRNIDIWIPDKCDSLKKMAVLYMHDGQMLFDSTVTWNKQEWGVDEVIGKLIKTNEIRQCIVVGIWNVDGLRHSEYFPQKPFMSIDKEFRDSLLFEAKRYENKPLFTTDIQSDNYLKFIVFELKPFIDKNYATKTDAYNTFIAGSSMGGLISIYAICEYPGIFGGAACLSTHWPGIFSTRNNPVPNAFVEYLNMNLPPANNHNIYFDYGTETLDSIYEPYQLKVDEIMKRKGYRKNNWKTMKFIGADHSEQSWNERLHIPITFLLRSD